MTEIMVANRQCYNGPGKKLINEVKVDYELQLKVLCYSSTLLKCLCLKFKVIVLFQYWLQLKIGNWKSQNWQKLLSKVNYLKLLDLL